MQPRYVSPRLGRSLTGAAIGAAFALTLGGSLAGSTAPQRSKRPARPPAVAAPAPAAGIRLVRRLNRAEYENTIRDLLGIRVSLKELLPPDTPAGGFDNVGEGLHVSQFLMERYLEAADRALDLAIAGHAQPPLFHKTLDPRQERVVKVATERVYRQTDDALILFSSSAWNAITVGQFYPPDRGLHRFRITARAVQTDRPQTLRVDAGPMLMGTTNHLVGYFDVPPDKPAVIEFNDFLEARSTIRITPHGLANAQTVHQTGADQYTGPGIALQSIEVEGPLHDRWPPESHTRLFGELPQAPAPSRDYRKRFEVVSQDPTDARRILRAFAGRAYRRTVTDEDVRPLVELVERKRSEGYTFEQAVRVGLTGVLVSPEFLYLREPASPAKLDSFALASRLSYFFWSSMPDEELLQVAASGKLSQPQVLREQVERLLRDPKAAAFTENFTGQWLGLRDLDFTEPDRRLYPEYDDMLRAAMGEEPRLFFNEVLKEDLGVASFVASDFTFLNERLAKHYGIPGVSGHAFRKVPLPPGSHRGGVLTMAGILKVTANGTTTSPVVRGAWVLDRILGQAPPPPPSGVPAVEPDIRGAMTIREQLAKHREVPACAGCHTRIDPPGFALESYDVIGGWRENYRSVGRGEPVTIDGRRMPYAKGLKVDPADQLPDGRRFADMDALRTLLLADREQLARAMANRLLTYGTGRLPRPEDRPVVEAVLAKAKAKGYGLRTLVHELVQSKAFLYR